MPDAVVCENSNIYFMLYYKIIVEKERSSSDNPTDIYAYANVKLEM